MPAAKPHPKHIQQVDYIRAIACVGVTLFHLGGKALPGLKYAWLWIYMFFLLSGYIILKAIPKHYTWRMAHIFIAKRIARIEPPYIVSIALVLLLNIVYTKLGYLQEIKPDWPNLLGHLAYFNNFNGNKYVNPVYWTLGIEFQFYLFVALAFPIINSKWGGIFLLALSIASYFIHTPWSTMITMFPTFALGMLYFLYTSKQVKPWQALLISLPIIFISCYNSGWRETCTALFALLILALPLKTNAIISFFSTISFSLYLTHDTVGSRLVATMGQHLPKTLFFKAMEFGIGIVVSILFAWAFYLLVEKPCLKLSKRITYPSLPA